MNNELKTTAFEIRRIILDASKLANVGHIGSALSVADIMAALFGKVMYMPGTTDPHRDRFILSKGHAALALYAALYLNGILEYDSIVTYCKDDSLLGVHPDHYLTGVDFSTGSLGHGLSIGAGVALAAKLSGESYRAFVLVSDAECNEGSLWETVIFAAHHRLSNLVAIVDNNGQQAFGKTVDVLDMNPLGHKWRAFGWDVNEVDGHDVETLAAAVDGLDTQNGPPKAIIANTVCGNGVSFMEGRVEWHYLPMSEQQYLNAMAEIRERVT